ncbi:MAG: Lrp/AsnC family transcriptional regulator [Nitrosopumilus sp.]|jgi:DNA-binding Lrp family transcriptional regulator|nr:Lrp/AsnC family transcriptional regulator [Nitrosopumilus sp.]MBT3685416.1 Lrp/AsnC family transcriptional regulator [Nitrosopumilus sp.]MBT3925332.1 Lrp/AsnC family transcriptional regulator [Nitrosopumilus sp.]MBT4216700.1 Lrp/AsnC family transcriptional regulator [Nitrosopumilus sp.]MBT4550906.1 Lrp/AsnC family transcriptional regulator [Nitrosopumilus sp.]
MSKAYVMMNCKLGEEESVIQSLKKIVGIKEAHGTLGLYDIIAQIECTTDEKIQEIVTQQIRKISKIQTSMTLTSSESGELFQISEKLVGAMLGKNSSKAYVVFHCEKGQEYPTLKNLCKIPEVKEADVVFGYYDVICRMESSSEEVLQDVITRAIRGIPNLKTSMTLNIIKEQETQDN